MKRESIVELDESYREYLSDESKLIGNAESISFPESEQEIRDIYQFMQKERIPITIQGGRTGVAGGAVPFGGHIINLSRMNKLSGFEISDSGENLLKVQPGVTLLELELEI
ncbi:MAG: FAD-binding protein, partial [Spirochaetales bacterium]|nr:FAD-binding protein [Spirochaetales bacterium]